MVAAAVEGEIAKVVVTGQKMEQSLPLLGRTYSYIATQTVIDRSRVHGAGYGLLVLAGLGIFCGCVGKMPSFRCMSGCPMPWKVPRPSAR